MPRNSTSPRPGRALFVAVAFAAALASPVVTEPLMAQSISTGDARAGAVMAVPVNKSQVLKLDRAFSKAMVGNAEIADVMPLNANSVYVLGKATGSTNLALYDRNGGLIAVVDVIVGPDVLSLKRQISEVFPGENVRISNSNDSLLIEGQVSSALAAERIIAIAQTYAPEKVLNLMSVGSPQQVLLEVRISEMSRGTVKELGLRSITWNGGPLTPEGYRNPGGGQVGRAAAIENGPFVGLIAGIFGTNLDVTFEALERQGLVRTLANPNLVALSGESASFLAGGELPIPSGVDNNGRVSIEFKPFGVAIAFTPTVLADGLINLRVAPEVSSIDREVTIELDGASVPGLKVRRALTSLELRDGQSFAMAGLIQSDTVDSVRGIPLLGKLPIIGALFRSTAFQKNETELVIVVTPRIVRPVRPDQITLPTDRVQAPGAMDLFLLGKTENRVPLAPSSSPKPGGVDGESGHIVR